MARRIGWSLKVLFVLALSGCHYVQEPPQPVVAQQPLFGSPQTGAVVPSSASGLPAPETTMPTPIPQSNAPQVRVGLLVPLSGPQAELGQNLLDAGMLALYDKYAGTATYPVQVVLLPKDTAGTPQGAAKAAQDAIDEGAQLLIGPVFTEEVKAVAEVAHKKNIAMVTFSNNRNNGDADTFLFGFMPDQAVIRVMDEAYGRNYKKIGVLAPNNEFGQLVGDAARKAANARGQELVGVEFYPPGTTDFSQYIERLIGGRVPSGQTADIDAVMLAEGGAAVRTMANTLFQMAGKPVRLLGTGLWDDPTVTGSRELAGGWLGSSPLRQSKGFEQRFRNYYGYTPLRISSLAYDAVALATTLAMFPTGADFSAGRLTDANGFNGPANGIFRFHTDGSIERGLSVLEITPTGFQEISPAPRAFIAN